MPKINIDDLCEPIEITIGGKNYKVEDISEKQAFRLQKIGNDAKKKQDAGEDADPKDSEAMNSIMAEILGAEKTELAKLGMRKRVMLVTQLMETINEELEAKNSPGADAAELPK